MDKILYYPYINIPKSPWTTRSILYWDTVGVIVPYVYIENPNRLQLHMRELVELELVEQVFPYTYMNQAQNFDYAFIALTNNVGFGLQKRQTSFRRGRLARLHVQKFGDRLFDHFRSIGLAIPENDEWWFVEESTAKLLMIYLATVIGRCGNYMPVTDKRKHIDFTLGQDRHLQNRHVIRNRYLNDLMPYPLNPDLRALKQFKERYDNQLRLFRSLLEQVIFNVEMIEDEDQRNTLYNLKLDEIMVRREEIARRLSESNNGKVVFGNVFGLAAAAVGISTENDPLGIFGIVNTAYQALSPNPTNPALHEDYAYLALLDNNHYIGNRSLFKRR